MGAHAHRKFPAPLCPWPPSSRHLIGPLDSATRTRTSTRFDCPVLAKILWKIVISMFAAHVAQLFLLLVTEPFCWSKNAKTSTMFLTCFADTACSCFLRLYLKKLAVTSITHYAAPGRITYNEAISGKFVETQVGHSFGPT